MPKALQQILFSHTGIPRLERVLNLSARRQKLLATHVANAETPGYQRQDIDLESERKAAVAQNVPAGVKTTRPEHLQSQPPVHTDQVVASGATTAAGASVQLDQEMPKAAENQLQFNIAARLTSQKFDGLRLAIRGR
ncbi:MAG: flagellar basal body rod protein FlgB [candidate division Zixibacteria bacterium]|nr:flagellar basal body rod protein FlgB [candidate division Zixibacteria bacterium]